MRKNIQTIIFSIVALLFVLLFMSSCKPTPKEPEVINKNDGKMEDKIQESATTDNNENTVKLEIPSRHQQSFSLYDDKLKVTIDAKVEFPVAQSFPIYEFTYKPFSQEHVDLIIKELIGNVDLYTPDYKATKSELEIRLIQMKKELNDKKNGIVNPSSEGGSTIEEYEQMIKDLEQQIINAPETDTNTKITSQEYSKQNNSIDTVAHVEGKGDIAFSIINNNLNASQLNYDVLPVYNQVGSFVTGDVGLTISKEQAIELAKKTADNLGADYMEPVAVVVAESGDFASENKAEAYTVIFTRKQDNLQTLYTGWDTSLDENDDYSAMMQYEILKIIVNNSGVVGIRWLGNGEFGEKINENAQILSFEDIMKRFEKQIGFNYSNSEPDKEFIIKIDKIKFGYLPIKQKDTGRLLWIPVWSFYGNGYYNDGSVNTEDYKENYRPLIILNAIDGSNIGC
jgi:hypothetical protein